MSCRAVKMDSDGGGVTMEPPPPELHSSILRAIGLNPKQRRAALAYRNHLLVRMGATLRQRRDISLQLLRTLGTQLPPDKQVEHYLSKLIHIGAVYSQAASSGCTIPCVALMPCSDSMCSLLLQLCRPLGAQLLASKQVPHPVLLWRLCHAE